MKAKEKWANVTFIILILYWNELNCFNVTCMYLEQSKHVEHPPAKVKQHPTT